MNVSKIFPAILGLTVLSTSTALMTFQTADEAARDLARRAVSSELHLTPEKFLCIHRDEDLENSLAIATIGRRTGTEFIYKISQTGIELKENAIIRHVATDADLVYIIAVHTTDGRTFRIRGFTDSLAEFQKLLKALKIKPSSPEQAESLADFYRGVNPENLPLTPLSSLIELKQAAERQCHAGVTSFDTAGEAFNAWWGHNKKLYVAISFQQRIVPHDGDYLVQWVILSSPSDGNCGGTPLRAQLEVGSDGHVGKLTFSPIRKPVDHP